MDKFVRNDFLWHKERKEMGVKNWNTLSTYCTLLLIPYDIDLYIIFVLIYYQNDYNIWSMAKLLHIIKKNQYINDISKYWYK